MMIEILAAKGIGAILALCVSGLAWFTWFILPQMILNFTIGKPDTVDRAMALLFRFFGVILVLFAILCWILIFAQ